MKKYFLLILISIILMLFTSCPQYIVVGTVWKGTINNLGVKSTDVSGLPFFYNDQAAIEMYFSPANTVRIFLSVYISGNYTFTEDGDFNITPITYVMKSSAAGKDLLGNTSFQMDGYVNTATGTGSGTYTLTFTDGTYQGDIYTGNWNIGKVN
jgi:hypothetical protein